MASFNGRPAPNVSQYLRELNTISPLDTTGTEAFIEDDLSIFTNTQFYDYETGQKTDYQAQPSKVATAAPTPAASTAGDAVLDDVSHLDFMSGEFNFGDFNTYPPPALNAFSEGAHSFQPLQPTHGAVYSSHGPQFSQSTARTGEKRTADSIISPGTSESLEDSSRQAAEEDKRRRNTAASARFRIKKKQREQALEKSAKEMTDKVTSLESKVSQLETENKWLKNLLVDKNGGNEDITTLWNEFTKNAAKRKP